MNKIVEQLHEDHKQLVRILFHLEKEVKALSGLAAPAGSLEVIINILDYIQEYPEIWHHPTEDVLFEVLLDKDVGGVAVLTELMEEHSMLELLTANLHEYINKIAVDAPDRERALAMRFVKSTSDYISRQLNHMERERQQLFPLVDMHLNQSDWDLIQQRLDKQLPSTDETALEYYRSFYQSIANTHPVTAG